MTDRTLREKAAKLQALDEQMATLEAQAAKLKADITAELDNRAVDELKAGSAFIRWKEVTTNRFDGRAFKQAYSCLYEQFTRPSTTRRFTLASA